MTKLLVLGSVNLLLLATSVIYLRHKIIFRKNISIVTDLWFLFLGLWVTGLLIGALVVLDSLERNTPTMHSFLKGAQVAMSSTAIMLFGFSLFCGLFAIRRL